MAGKKGKKLADVLKVQVDQTPDGVRLIRINEKSKTHKLQKGLSKETRAEIKANRKRMLKEFVLMNEENIHEGFAHINDGKPKLPKWVTGWSETVAGKETRNEGFAALLKRLKLKVDGSKPLAENDVTELRFGLMKIQRATSEEGVSTALLNKFGSLQRLATDILRSITTPMELGAMNLLFDELFRGDSSVWGILCRKYNQVLQNKQQEKAKGAIDDNDFGPAMALRWYADVVGDDERTLKQLIVDKKIGRIQHSKRKVRLSVPDLTVAYDLLENTLRTSLKDKSLQNVARKKSFSTV